MSMALERLDRQSAALLPYHLRHVDSDIGNVCSSLILNYFIAKNELEYSYCVVHLVRWYMGHDDRHPDAICKIAIIG